jgi:predicted glycoside hydrolase/deacetylase ChbG (UPF0249 family)
MKMRGLIVNADDFGLTPGVNAGIIDAHTRGILTSSSMFANASATDHAIQLARQTPTLGTGCHLALVDANPVLPSSRLPTLAPEGHFRPTWRVFMTDVLAGRIAFDEIEQELAAQVSRLADAGLRLTHLDGHKHVHAFPPVFAIVARLARRFGIPTVRIPYESPSLALVARNAGRPGARRQAVQNVALAPWAWRDRLLLKRLELAPPPAFLGRVLTGMFTRDTVGGLLQRVGQGVSELMTHPGYPDAALDLVRTRLRQERAEEVAVLTDPAIVELVHREGIALVRHGQEEGPRSRKAH